MTTIYTHPDNLELLRREMQKSLPKRSSIWDMSMPELYGIKIRTSEVMERRKTRQQWFPPPNDRFVEYEESDHGWLKALGYGHTETIDEGPLFIEMKDPMAFMRFDACGASNPFSMLLTTI